MKQFLIACFVLTSFAAAWAQTPAPEGNIIYCSYANTRNDGWSRHFCELVNENGKTTVVVYDYNHGMEQPDERHYEVTADVAEQMEAMIRENKYYEIDGYKVFDSMMGGSTKRVYMEFSTGEHINAEWFAEKPNPLAVSAYADIAKFFQPWVEKAEQERNEARSQSEEVVEVDLDDDYGQVTTAKFKTRKVYKSSKKKSSKKKSSKKSKRR